MAFPPKLTVSFFHTLKTTLRSGFSNATRTIRNFLSPTAGSVCVMNCASAQGRLGPGRVHHCMRLIGVAERALELMTRRAHDRIAFGKKISEQGVVRQWISESRLAIEQARLLVLKTAWLMDEVGNKAARVEIAMIKAVVPQMALQIIDRAIQTHGGGGVCQDFPLANFWIYARSLRLADGPDEVHLESIAKMELKKYIAN